MRPAHAGEGCEAELSFAAGEGVRPTLAALMVAADPVETLGGAMELSEAAEPVPVTAAVRRVTRRTLSGVPAPSLESVHAASAMPSDTGAEPDGSVQQCLMLAADLEYRSYINPESRAKRIW